MNVYVGGRRGILGGGKERVQKTAMGVKGTTKGRYR